MRIIKTGTGDYISSKELENCAKACDIKYIYIPDGNKKLLPSFIVNLAEVRLIDDLRVFSGEEDIDIVKLIKNAYNPLLDIQNTLFITEAYEIAFQLPQSYIKLSDNVEKIKAFINNAIEKDLMRELILYSITKDLSFMNKLTEHCFDPGAFNLCQEFLNEPENEEIKDSLKAALMRKHYQNAILAEQDFDNEERKKHIREAVRAEGSQKNIIFIHLESISQLIFNANRHLMPAISKIFNKSLNFSRYYSSATSTIMAISAIFHGNDFEIDKFTGYEEIMLEKPYSENIFKILGKNGYETRSFIYTNPALSAEIYGAKIYDDGSSGDGRIFDYDKFLSGIEQFFENNKNGKFATFIDYEPTHCGVNDEETAKIPIFEQKAKLTYIRLNDMVEFIWTKLREKGLLNKTIVVIYGDHGDDKWTRCINNGFSHMTEPYLSSIHTPLAIYNSPLPHMYVDGIMSSIDLKPTLLYMLGVNNPDTFPYSGINIFEKANDCVYSAALFANQSDTESIGSFAMAKLNGFSRLELKNKSFCVINDSFCLIAGKDGLQLFNNESDPLSYNNLLNFYEFDENGQAVKFNNHGAWRGHFRLEIMADAQIYECLKSLYELRRKLKERIEAKNAFVGNLENPFDFGSLDRVRERGYI